MDERQIKYNSRLDRIANKLSKLNIRVTFINNIYITFMLKAYNVYITFVLNVCFI